jgi:hypothetical protein
MMKESTMVCDKCQAVITRVTNLPPEGWPKLHCLCSACFAEAVAKQA